MPSLNKEVCFQDPIQPIQANQQQLPINWMSRLAFMTDGDLASKRNLYRGLLRHTQVNFDLGRSLAQLYFFLNDSKQDTLVKQQVLSGLADGIEQCEQGYYNRIQNLLQLINFPQSIEGLIALYRFELVDKAARYIVDNKAEGVHIHNGVFIEANQMGLGVLPIRSEDEYSGMLVDGGAKDETRKYLDEIFTKNYTFFNTLIEVEQHIKNKTIDYGYNGKLDQETGNYGAVDAGTMLDFIKQYLPDMEAVDILVMSDDMSRYLDLNWQKIRVALIKRLVDVEYFDLSLNELKVLDYISDLIVTISKVTNLDDLPGEFNSIFYDKSEFLKFIDYFDLFSSEQKLFLILNKFDVNNINRLELTKLIDILQPEQIEQLLSKYDISRLKAKLTDIDIIKKLLIKYSSAQILELFNKLGKDNLSKYSNVELSILLDVWPNDILVEFEELCASGNISNRVNNVYELGNIISRLSGTKVEKILNILGKDLIESKIKSPIDLYILVEVLSIDQLKQLLEFIGIDQQRNLVTNSFRSEQASTNGLSKKLIKVLCAVEKSYLQELISNEEILLKVLDAGSDEVNRSICVKLDCEHLALLIDQQEAFINVIKVLDISEVKLFIDRYNKLKLEDFIPDFNCLREILDQIDSEKAFILINSLFELHLRDLLVTSRQLGEVLIKVGVANSNVIINKLGADCVKDIMSDVIDDPSGLNLIMKSIAGEYKWQFVKDVLGFDFLTNFTNAKNLSDILFRLNEQHVTHLMTEVFSINRLVDMIEDIVDLEVVTPLLTTEQKDQLLAKLDFLTFIKSATDLEELFDLLPAYGHDIINNYIGLENIAGFVTSHADFTRVLQIDSLIDEQKLDLCKYIDYNKFVHIPKDVRLLIALAPTDAGDQIINDYLGMEKLNDMVFSVDTFVELWNVLNTEQQDNLIEKLNWHNIVLNPDRLKKLFEELPDQKNRFITRVIGLDIIADIASESFEDLREVLKLLAKEQQDELVGKIKSDELITDFASIKNAFNSFYLIEHDMVLNKIVGVDKINDLVDDINKLSELWVILNIDQQVQVLENLDLSNLIKDEKQLYDLLNSVPKQRRFYLLMQLEESGKLSTKLADLCAFLVELDAEQSDSFLSDYVISLNWTRISDLCQLVSKLDDEHSYLFLANIIGMDIIRSKIVNTGALRQALGLLKTNEQKDEFLSELSSEQWCSLVANKFDFIACLQILSPEQIKLMLNQLGDQHLLATIFNSSDSKQYFAKLLSLGLAQKKVDAIFDSVSAKVLQHKINNAQTLDIVLSHLYQLKQTGLINKLGSKKLKQLVAGRQDFIDVIAKKSLPFKQALVADLGITYVTDLYINSSLADYKMLFEIISDNDKRLWLINELAKNKSFEHSKLSANEFYRKNSGLTSEQFDNLIKSLGSKKLKSMYLNHNDLVRFLSSLKQDRYKYTSQALKHTVEIHKFNLVKIGSCAIAVGVISLAAIGAAAAIAIIPGIGLLILGLSGFATALTAAGVGTAAAVTTVASLTFGAYKLYQHKNLGELERTVCAEDKFKDTIAKKQRILKAG